jgi:hypothetical protein
MSISFVSKSAAGFCFLFLLAFSPAAMAEDIKVDAQLIWGTDDDKAPDPKTKRVDAELAKKLGNIFKWKNYFIITRQTVPIPSRQTKKVEMSKKCTVEITEMEGPRVEVKIYGEGKLLHAVKAAMVPGGDALIYAGDDQNACAWFVVLQAVR